jgi:DNA adenine methylase
MVPKGIGTYYEPFLGGGSLFFALLPDEAVLSDLNELLVEVYECLRDKPLQLIAALEQWRNDETTYYSVRNSHYADQVHRAAQLIYLNRTCWNGLYRVNRSGGFNVPFGYHGRQIFDGAHLLEISTALQTARFRCGDFSIAVRNAKRGDFVYFDPPYTTRHSRNGFLRYNNHLFSWEDQERLGQTAVELAERGCQVVVSNASYEPILSLYPGFQWETVSRSSVLAADPKHRNMITEFLIYSASDLGQHNNGKTG